MGKLATLVLVLAAAALGSPAQATQAVFSFTENFSGKPGSDVTTPWLTATFSQLSTDTVRLTLTATGLDSHQRIDGVYFNVAGVAPSALTFSYVSGPPAVNVGSHTDAFKAGGSGMYDIQFSFSNKNTASTFTGGLSSTYLITGPGLTASAFVATASSSSGQGAFFGAGKVVHASSQGSSWVHAGAPVTAAPELHIYAMMLFGLGMVGAMVRRRGRLQSSAA